MCTVNYLDDGDETPVTYNDGGKKEVYVVIEIKLRKQISMNVDAPDIFS